MCSLKTPDLSLHVQWKSQTGGNESIRNYFTQAHHSLTPSLIPLSLVSSGRLFYDLLSLFDSTDLVLCKIQVYNKLVFPLYPEGYVYSVTYS